MELLCAAAPVFNQAHNLFFGTDPGSENDSCAFECRVIVEAANECPSGHWLLPFGLLHGVISIRSMLQFEDADMMT